MSPIPVVARGKTARAQGPRPIPPSWSDPGQIVQHLTSGWQGPQGKAPPWVPRVLLPSPRRSTSAYSQSRGEGLPVSPSARARLGCGYAWGSHPQKSQAQARPPPRLTTETPPRQARGRSRGSICLGTGPPCPLPVPPGAPRPLPGGFQAAAPDVPSESPESKATPCSAPAEAPNSMRASRTMCGACSLRQRVAPMW